MTGWFCHTSGQVYDVVVEGEREPLGITGAHPVWSVDRQQWVPVVDLREGERLSAQDGREVRVVSVALRAGREPVYNIEVDGQHCYRVGEQGLLVHNQSAPTWCTSMSAPYRLVIPEATLFVRHQVPALTTGYITRAPDNRIHVYIIPVQKEVHGILPDPRTATGGSDPGSALADYFGPPAYWVNMFTFPPRPAVADIRMYLLAAIAAGVLPGLAQPSDTAAGHIYGEQFGGPGRPYTTAGGDMALPNNLFPSARATETAIGHHETIWRNNAIAGNKVCVRWHFGYPGGGCNFADRDPSRCRPSTITIEYWIECAGVWSHSTPPAITQ